jgi:hypothetical protein
VEVVACGQDRSHPNSYLMCVGGEFNMGFVLPSTACSLVWRSGLLHTIHDCASKRQSCDSGGFPPWFDHPTLTATLMSLLPAGPSRQAAPGAAERAPGRVCGDG